MPLLLWRQRHFVHALIFLAFSIPRPSEARAHLACVRRYRVTTLLLRREAKMAKAFRGGNVSSFSAGSVQPPLISCLQKWTPLSALATLSRLEASHTDIFHCVLLFLDSCYCLSTRIARCVYTLVSRSLPSLVPCGQLLAATSLFPDEMHGEEATYVCVSGVGGGSLGVNGACYFRRSPPVMITSKLSPCQWLSCKGYFTGSIFLLLAW